MESSRRSLSPTSLRNKHKRKHSNKTYTHTKLRIRNRSNNKLSLIFTDSILFYLKHEYLHFASQLALTYPHTHTHTHTHTLTHTHTHTHSHSHTHTHSHSHSYTHCTPPDRAASVFAEPSEHTPKVHVRDTKECHYPIILWKHQ